jgi:hypothetical protein
MRAEKLANQRALRLSPTALQKEGLEHKNQQRWEGTYDNGTNDGSKYNVSKCS